jgi:hypothetical protein
VGIAQRTQRLRRLVGLPRPRRRSGFTQLARVVITYAPEVDGEPDPGEVVWAWVPYEEDVTRGKDRPLVVIGVEADELVGVALTSRPRRGRFRLGRGAWDGFGHVSWAKLDQIVRLPAGEFRREGATLERPRFDALIAELRRRHGLDG